MIKMIEPTDPQERKDAIWICRVNAFLDPETGLPDDPKRSLKLWGAGPDLPYSKWIWMWNYGISEWRTAPHSEEGKR